MTTDHVEAPSSKRRLAWIGAGLTLIAVLTAILLAARSPASFEPGSPEAVVQTYLQAVLDGDLAAATALFSQDSDCSTDDFRFRNDTSNVRITLIDSDEFDDRATVEVRIRFDEGAIDSLSSYDIDERFHLVSESGSWLITGAPWPLYFCEEPP